MTPCFTPLFHALLIVAALTGLGLAAAALLTWLAPARRGEERPVPPTTPEKRP